MEVRRRYYWKTNSDGSKEKVYYYPVTHIDAVLGANDRTLSGRLADVSARIQRIDGLDSDTAASSATAKDYKNVQPDWNETDSTSYAYIKNKPEISQDIDEVVGSLSDLQTTDKTSIVNAINEVANKDSGTLMLFDVDTSDGCVYLTEASETDFDFSVGDDGNMYIEL